MIVDINYQLAVHHFEWSAQMLLLSPNAHHSTAVYLSTLIEEVFANIIGEQQNSYRRPGLEREHPHLAFEKACYLKVQILDETALQPNTPNLLRSASPAEKALINTFLEQLSPRCATLALDSLKTAVLLFAIPRIHHFVTSKWFHPHEFIPTPSPLLSSAGYHTPSYAPPSETVAPPQPPTGHSHGFKTHSFSPSPISRAPSDFSSAPPRDQDQIVFHFFP